jgi:5-methyltetrahydrofolate--homocysteine methyltransferase
MLSLAQARANRLATDWDNLAIPVPWFLGRRNIKPSLDDLLPLVRLPADLADEARALIGVLRLGPLDARGVYGFWAAQSIGDDIAIYKDDARAAELVRLHTLRQQDTRQGEPSLSLADFVAPRETLAPDYIGAYALTVNIDVAALGRPSISGGPERIGLVARVVTERLADAFAEHLHQQARRDWGYGADEDLTREALVAGNYRGIRVSPGSPALPDPSERVGIVRLLHLEEIGVALDSAYRVTPEVSILGFYFGHPEARLFEVGRVGRDQLVDHAHRKGLEIDTADESWLS